MTLGLSFEEMTVSTVLYVENFHVSENGKKKKPLSNAKLL